MKVHLTYLGFYEAHKTGVIPLKDKHVYKITCIEGSFAIPIAWTTDTVYARVGDYITEQNVQYATAKNFSIIVT